MSDNGIWFIITVTIMLAWIPITAALETHQLRKQQHMTHCRHCNERIHHYTEGWAIPKLRTTPELGINPYTCRNNTTGHQPR